VLYFIPGTGFAIIIVNFICTVYYNVIISYPIYFLFLSMRSELPWEECNHEWNTDKCLKVIRVLLQQTGLSNFTNVYIENSATLGCGRGGNRYKLPEPGRPELYAKKFVLPGPVSTLGGPDQKFRPVWQ